MKKIEENDLLRLKLVNVTFDRDQTLVLVEELQESNAQLALQLARLNNDHRKASAEKAQAALVKITEELMVKYGITDPTKVNWATGEIEEEETTTGVASADSRTEE